MSEHDAHNALTATARMRALAEPVEDGKLMTFSERMYRAREARHMHETMRGEGHARAMVNNPVYRNMSGLASLNRYFAWGPDLRPWPGEIEYLAGAKLRPGSHGQHGPTGTRGCVKSVNSDTLVNYGARHNGLTFNDTRLRR